MLGWHISILQYAISCRYIGKTMFLELWTFSSLELLALINKRVYSVAVVIEKHAASFISALLSK